MKTGRKTTAYVCWLFKDDDDVISLLPAEVAVSLPAAAALMFI